MVAAFIRRVLITMPRELEASGNCGRPADRERVLVARAQLRAAAMS